MPDTDRYKKTEDLSEARRQKREWSAALERLVAWHESHEALAEELGTTKNAIGLYLAGEKEPVEKRKKKILDLHTRMKRMPQVAGEAAITLLQVISVIEEKILTPEQLQAVDTRWQLAKKRVERLAERLVEDE
jgi:transcriptional regulator with XRE-family HTH domain